MNNQIKSLLNNNKCKYEIIKRNLNEDHLKEGIGTYIYTKPTQKKNPNIFVNKPKYSKIKYASRAYYITQRVLYPDKDIFKGRPCTKRILSVEKNIQKSNDGIFKSFIDKTPFQYPAKTKKNINRSYDNARKEHDIFLRDKNDDSKTFRIFGVERKKINKNPNYESEVPKFKFYRKLFCEKAKNMKNIYL